MTVAAKQVWEVRDGLGILPPRVFYLVEKRDAFIPYFVCLDLEEGVKTTILVSSFHSDFATRLV